MSTPITITITIGQTIHLETGDFTVVEWGGGNFRLRNELTDEYEIIDHIELSRQLRAELKLAGQASTEEKPKSKHTLGEVLDDLDEATLFLIPHLQELIDGTPAVGDEPREKYAPHVPMTSKLLSKAKELKEDYGFLISDGTLKRRMLHFRKGGIAALRDGRTVRQERPLRRADEKVTDALAELIASYVGRSSPTYSRIRAELHRNLIRQYPNPEERPQLPSLKTVERYVIKLAGNQNPVKPARQRETASLSPKNPHRPRQVSAPGDECQMDSTVLDCLVRFPDGNIRRPHLTILIDKRTRSIVAHNFTEGAAKGFDHAALLANALVPRRLRSWSTYYDTLGLPQMPWSAHHDNKQLEEFDTHRPYIFPRRILTDNGTDYRSNVFRLACERYGIHLTEAPKKSPASKAIVERAFHTIKTHFTQYLHGYTSGNIESRGEKVASEAVLDLDVVRELFDRWVAVIYQNKRHRGLVDPINPDQRHSPNSMFAASMEISGHFVLAWEEEDFISLMPRETRTVQADGVEINKRKYDSPHLTLLRGKKTANGEGKSVDVHYDPNDLNRVWVRAANDSWIECTWKRQEGLSRPMERLYNQRVHDFSRDNVSFSAAEADDHMLEFLDAVIAENAELKRQAAEEEQALQEAERSQRRKSSIADAKKRANDGFDDLDDDIPDLRIV